VCDFRGNFCIVSCYALTAAPFLSVERDCREYGPRAVSSVKLLISLYFTLYTKDSFVINVSSFSFISPTLHHVVLLNLSMPEGQILLKRTSFITGKGRLSPL